MFSVKLSKRDSALDINGFGTCRTFLLPTIADHCLTGTYSFTGPSRKENIRHIYGFTGWPHNFR